MTRKEIEIIRTMEKNAWTELQKYNYENAPRHGNAETWIEWDLHDLRHAELLNYWVSLHDLMEELKIETEWSEEASYYVNALYNERTNTTEEPTEETVKEEEPTKTEEIETHEPIYCSVLVRDRRSTSGINSRVKYCDTIDDCKTWVKSVKNRVSNQFNIRVVENNVCVWHTISL